MLKASIFKESIIVLLLVWILHILAMANYWYWKYNYFDVPMHFLGGLLIGLLSFWIVSFSKKEYQFKSFIFAIIFGIVTAFVVGVFWEIFENINGIAVVGFENYQLDTSIDLVMDCLGGLVAGIYAFKVFSHKSKFING